MGPRGQRLVLPVRALRVRGDRRDLRPARRRARGVAARHRLRVGSGRAPRRRDGRRRWPASTPPPTLIAIARTARRPPTCGSARCSNCRGPTDSLRRRVSINGIWGGCEAALDEAFRVLRPGGRDRYQLLGQRPAARPARVLQGVRPARAAAALRLDEAAEQHQHAGRRRGDARGERVRGSSSAGSAISTIEWPDADLAWRRFRQPRPGRAGARHGDADGDQERGPRRARSLPGRSAASTGSATTTSSSSPANRDPARPLPPPPLSWEWTVLSRAYSHEAGPVIAPQGPGWGRRRPVRGRRGHRRGPGRGGPPRTRPAAAPTGSVATPAGPARQPTASTSHGASSRKFPPRTRGGG